MATGASSGGYGVLAWIAGGAVVAGVAAGGMYFAGLIGPSDLDDSAELTVSAPDQAQPDTADTVPPPQPAPSADGEVQPDTTAEATVATPDQATPDNTATARAEPETSETEPTLSAPGFDVVRVDPDGNAVIAGTGPAGAQVTIFLDGEEQVSTTIDRSGAFVSLLSIAPSQSARILSMTAELNGQTRPSDDQIILAPTPIAEPPAVDDVQTAAVAPVDGGQPSNNQDAAGAGQPTEPGDPDDPGSETVLAQSDEGTAEPAVASDQPAELAGVEPAQPVATDETATSSSAENIQTAAADPAQIDEPAPGAKADGVGDATEPDPTEGETAQADPSRIELAQNEPDAPTDNTQGGAVQVAQAKPSEPVTSPTPDTAQPAAQVADPDATASGLATTRTTSQPSRQNQQTAETSPGQATEAAPDDQGSDPAPVKAEPAPSDNTETEVASVTTTAAAPTSDKPAASDVQATDTPTNTPPVDQNIETAALGEPTGETPVNPSQPLAPTPRQDVTSAVPELAPAPVQPLTPSQSAIQSQPQSSAVITILRTGPDGVEVLQSGASRPQTPDKIALDLISYSEAGEIQLSGRAQARSVVRVYLDNRPVGDLVTDDAGRWSGEVEGIVPGIYTLRLDELGQAGRVLSRIETPFKRESPDVLRPPQDPNSVATSDTADGGPVPPVRAVTVQQGDTLWAISRERYGDGVLYVRVFEANRGDIRDPDLIYPGQVFALPE